MWLGYHEARIYLTHADKRLMNQIFQSKSVHCYVSWKIMRCK